MDYLNLEGKTKIGNLHIYKVWPDFDVFTAMISMTVNLPIILGTAEFHKHSCYAIHRHYFGYVQAIKDFCLLFQTKLGRTLNSFPFR